MGNCVSPPAPPSIPPEHPFLSVSLLAAFRLRVPFGKRYSSRFRSARSSTSRSDHAHWLEGSAKANRTSLGACSLVGACPGEELREVTSLLWNFHPVSLRAKRLRATLPFFYGWPSVLLPRPSRLQRCSTLRAIEALPPETKRRVSRALEQASPKG